MPDIKDTGALVEFVRWGNPFHGLLDGTTLDGATFPALRGYMQHGGLWVTPVQRLVVPSYTPPTLPDPVAGATWLGYGLLSGMYCQMYRTNLGIVSLKNYWLCSFGAGDTWTASITSSSAEANASNGTATVNIGLTRRGNLTAPLDGITSINLSATLAPIGQPSFVGDNTDFASSDFSLRVIDISSSGQQALIGIMPLDVAYDGFDVPRGVLLLTLTRSSATLSVFKSRSDMLYSCTKATTYVDNGTPLDRSCTVPGTLTWPAADIDSNTTWSTSRCVGAYFDSSDTARPINEAISTQYIYSLSSSSWTQSCGLCTFGELDACTTPDGQTVNHLFVNTVTQTVTLSNGVSAIGSATYTGQISTAGTSVSSGGSFTNNATDTYSISHTQLSGRVYTGGSSVIQDETVTSLPGIAGGGAVYDYEYRLPVDMDAAADGTYTRRPWELNDTSLPEKSISQITFGAVSHFSRYSLEFSTFHARTGVGGYVAAAPPDASADNEIVSIHPQTGATASKRGTWAASPSFGWV